MHRSKQYPKIKRISGIRAFLVNWGARFYFPDDTYKEGRSLKISIANPAAIDLAWQQIVKLFKVVEAEDILEIYNYDE